MEQQIYIGNDSISKLLLLLQDYAPDELFLVRGKNSYGYCGAKTEIDRIISILGCKVIEYSGFQENPKLEDLERGLSLLYASEAKIIVAVGGGSVLDMAKLIRFFNSYIGDPLGHDFRKKKELIPLFALPTTAGTGSETTQFAVLYNNKVKYSVEHENIRPTYANIYPPFTYNNPKYLTACTGFDALAQAIEAFWNLNACDESDEYAEKAIRTLWENLPLSVNSPTEDIRNKVSEASYWAGRAINITKTTAPHAFSYPFTTYYDYPHGHAVALTFPYIAAINLSVKTRRQKHICSLLGIDNSHIVEDVFLKYLSNIGLCKRVNDSFCSNLILNNINLNRLKNNPIAIDKDMAISIISKI